jgi:DNA-directed RNA polymerase specialized sigma24 family protein
MSVKSPAFIERTVSVEQGLWAPGAEQSAAVRRLERRVMRLLPRLPPLEADWVHLFYFKRLSQETIAALFDCTQPSVHYRLNRATERLRFLLQLPVASSPDCVAQALRELGAQLRLEAVDIELVRHMLETTCQSETGARLGFTQGKVRYRYHRVVERLAQYLCDERAAVDPQHFRRLSAHLRALKLVAENPNVLARE